MAIIGESWTMTTSKVILAVIPASLGTQAAVPDPNLLDAGFQLFPMPWKQQ
jgi:hypothetical protein